MRLLNVWSPLLVPFEKRKQSEQREQNPAQRQTREAGTSSNTFKADCRRSRWPVQ